jgi:RNA polymerase sigma-70 factor, ECF subfamily
MKILSAIFAMSDEQAMWRVQMHDDAQAFAQLVARWEDPIKRLCIRMLADEHKADDVTQEAFTRVYSKRKDFQHGSKFSTFLWRVATNLCLDELRRIKRRRELAAFPETRDSGETDIWEELPSKEESPDHAAVQDENALLVREAVMQLPEHYRSVVILRHYEDLKFREIAEVLGIPEGTVKSRMSEALSLLNHTLQKSLSDKQSAPKIRIVPPQREALLL